MTTHKPWDIISTEWLVTFPDFSTAEQLWLKVWELFVYLAAHYFKEWEVVVLSIDDWTNCPYFSNWKKRKAACLCNFAPLSQKKTLPQYFAIKKCNHPLWQEYIDWLNEKYNITIIGTLTNIYYWFDGVVKQHYYPSNFKNNPTILTLEEWKEMIEEANVEANVDDQTDINVPLYTHTISRKWAIFTKDTINGKYVLDIQKQYEELGKLIDEHKSLTF